MPERAPPVEFRYWVGFFIGLVLIIILDLFVFHRKAHRVKAREALLWTTFWISLAVAFNLWIAVKFGQQRALEFTTGYLIEEALSIDNLFVFVVIFRYFQVKPEYQHRILFWGILGAILMRLAFVLIGTELIHHFQFIVYVMGVFLIFTGVKLLFQKETAVDPGRSWILRFFRRYVPTTEEYEGVRFIVTRGGRRYATPLLLVLIVVETTDLVFAVDSVPAIIAITPDSFIVFTSNIFAILGLRSLYFLLAGMMEFFRFLKVGLSLVLTFVGIKMLVPDTVLHMPIQVSLGVIAGILATAIIASLVRPGTGGSRLPPEEEPPDQGAAEEG